jgi:hypothetical protein
MVEDLSSKVAQENTVRIQLKHREYTRDEITRYGLVLMKDGSVFRTLSPGYGIFMGTLKK